MTTPRLLRASLAAAFCAASFTLPLSAQSYRTVPTAAPEFVEVPGEREFRGFMLARPLQVADAESFGLSAAEVVSRASLAHELLGAYEFVRYEHRTDETFFAVPEGSSEQEVADELLASGAFQYVEPDWRLYPVGCPNDSGFGSQWHHAANLMNSCAGWDIATGDPSTVVAICDTGLRTSHQDIQLHRQEGYNAVDQQFENSGGDISPVHPHGTMTTGCAAANGDNGVGISGVGWNLGHRMMRVSNDSSGGSTIGALTHAAMVAADLGDRVASVSYSGVDSSSVQSAGQYCRSQGALLVWAAGNSSTNLGGTRDDFVIVVGATDSNDNLASFSSYGSFVDLVAPGVNVFTMDSGNNSDYASVSGTSFSCPLTAGLCALMFSANPSLTPDQVEDALRQGCDDLGANGVDNTFGYGRIDVAGSLALANSAIQITFPSGRPDYVDPAGGTPLSVNVAAGATSAVPNSGRLHVDSGSGFQISSLVETSPGVHSGSFPAAPCGNQVSWYVDFDLVGGGTQSAPVTAPADTYSADAWVVNNAFFDDVESAGSWTGGVSGDDATTGEWTFGNPIGTAAQPEDDHSVPGSNCWFTGQGSSGGSLGENDIDGGTTTLLSPVLNASGLSEPTISYWRWYVNSGNSAVDDQFVVDITNGGSWINVETLSGSQSGGWKNHVFTVSDFVTPTSTVQLRFRASDLGSGSIVEAAIDDVSMDDLSCGGGCGSVVNYCQTSSNSVGSGALITLAGSVSVAANDAVLVADSLPNNQPGIFYFGPNQIQVAFGNGFRCVGGTTTRLPPVTSSFGSVGYALDLNNLPFGAAINAGDTVNFQYWYRDPADGGMGFNLTDGLSATFCP